MKYITISIFLLVACFTQLSGQTQLSEDASIHIITVGPYQEELYSAFGHSGIRVYDPQNQIDYFYNYGVFDFNQPNFYLNFAKGFLNYRLAVMEYPRIRNYYIYQNRYIHEQILNLSRSERQELFEFLEWNARPENMNYYYDYFYDNCATRVRDAVKKAFKEKVTFDGSYITTDYTIRDLTDIYLQEQPWGDLGIDICLGLPMDKTATPHMYMFLPDYIEKAFNNATIERNGEKVELVKRTLVTNSSKAQPSAASPITPLYLFSIVAFILLFITYRGYRTKKHKRWIDIILFTVVGLVGWLLFLLWVATDHNAAANNFNLLWAIPFHFPLALFLLKKELPTWVIYYFLAIAVFEVLVILGWFLWPQDLHVSLIPIALVLLIRSYFIYYSNKK